MADLEPSADTLLTPDRLDRPRVADPLLERLFPALATGVEWDLERSRRALASLDDPHETFRAFHVGGTNGKGSVTAALASVLRAAGHRTGAYTSPHLRSFRERIVVDGRPLAEDALVRHADGIRDAVTRFGLTFFEAATMLAFHAFREEGVEVAAVEVGLGGRLDATNVLRPEVAAVTSVAMDHMEYLGDTLPAIAAEKAGIMKPGVPFVTAETDPALLALFRERAAAVGAPLHVLDPAAVRHVTVAADHTGFQLRTERWGDLSVVTRLVGRHQAVNTALAVTMLEHAPEPLVPDPRVLLDGIRAVRHPGRGDLRVLAGRTWLFDAAHNPAGAATLADMLDRLHLARPLVLLFGVLADKDWRAMLPPLLARAQSAVLTVPPTAPPGRRWDPRTAEGLGGATRVIEDFASAVREAARLAEGGTVVVTGSMHTVGDAMEVLEVDPSA